MVDIKCPFYPDCNYIGLAYDTVVHHIEQDHRVVGCVHYLDNYHGNGSNNIIKISNDEKY